MKNEEATKLIETELEIALLKARDDGLTRPQAEAILYRVFKHKPDSRIPPRSA